MGLRLHHNVSIMNYDFCVFFRESLNCSTRFTDRLKFFFGLMSTWIKLQLLFFTDVYLDVIKRSNLDGSDVRTIVTRSLKTMDGIAVDWVANNIYWTDAGPNVISVARLDGSSRLGEAPSYQMFLINVSI